MWYYEPKPENPEDLRLMRLLDEQYLKTPFYGVLRMTEWLKRLKEYVNRQTGSAAAAEDGA